MTAPSFDSASSTALDRHPPSATTLPLRLAMGLGGGVLLAILATLLAGNAQTSAAVGSLGLLLLLAWRFHLALHQHHRQQCFWHTELTRLLETPADIDPAALLVAAAERLERSERIRSETDYAGQALGQLSEESRRPGLRRTARSPAWPHRLSAQADQAGAAMTMLGTLLTAATLSAG